MAATSDLQIHYCQITREYRRPLLAPRTGGL